MYNKYFENIKDNIKNKIIVDDYNFLIENEYLNKNIIYLCMSGSFAYGTNVDTSDVDIRGISLNTSDEILLGKDHEEIVDEKTDTTIYTINKIFKLLINCNPNTIELLGVRDEDIVYVDEIGKMILENKHIFLSQKCINSFVGYANSQLRRLDNKSARLLDEEGHNEHIIGSMKNASINFVERYDIYEDDFQLKQVNKKICIKFSDKYFELENVNSMLTELHNVKKDYDKIGKRNQYAIEKNKLGKHSMHLIRLFLMCMDILKYGEINTYRKNEHNLLMDIRNGKYLDDNKQPTNEFLEMVEDYKKQMNELIKTAKLPLYPNYKEIEKLQIKINKMAIESAKCE